ncbi:MULTISPECIES: class B sortase [unclassified Butyrivibrio]|uniref:class B sortase n=1 Tax=unclassified Butyrivibrio TaxID=2639466 RepID=UPI0003B490AC|nr:MULTISPECIES: class B sortase [unclassified Butyrivibrio]MDC7292290.1 class B sortase [Butyrivibrio sp. DSM 10294]
MTKKVLNIIRIIVILACIGVIIYEGIHIYLDQKEYTVAEDEYTQLEINATSVALHNDEDAEVVDYPLISIDHQQLSSLNKDYVAWIYFPALEISYPVVKENTVNEYLHKTFDGTYNKAGCIFEDILSDENFCGMHDIVFGHNMKNGSMFGKLKQLYNSDNKDLIDSNPYIYIYTKDHVYKYRIFAYYKTVVGSSSYSVVESKSDYEEFIKFIEPKTIYKIPDDISFADYPGILTLSTCSGKSGSGSRFVIHSVKIGSYETAGN